MCSKTQSETTALAFFFFCICSACPFGTTINQYQYYGAVVLCTSYTRPTYMFIADTGVSPVNVFIYLFYSVLDTEPDDDDLRTCYRRWMRSLALPVYAFFVELFRFSCD